MPRIAAVPRDATWITYITTTSPDPFMFTIVQTITTYITTVPPETISTTPAAPTAQTTEQVRKGGPSNSVVGGAVIGSILGSVIIGVLLYWCCRRRDDFDEPEDFSQPDEIPPSEPRVPSREPVAPIPRRDDPTDENPVNEGPIHATGANSQVERPSFPTKGKQQNPHPTPFYSTRGNKHQHGPGNPGFEPTALPKAHAWTRISNGSTFTKPKKAVVTQTRLQRDGIHEEVPSHEQQGEPPG